MPALSTKPRPTHFDVRPFETGQTATVRAVFDGLGPTSRHQRFLVPKQTLTAADARALADVDHRHHEAVVASTDDGAPVGIGRFVRTAEDPTTAELALEVVDAWQRHGIGSALTIELVARARELGVRRFWIFISPENAGALRLVQHISDDIEYVDRSRQVVELVVRLPHDSPSTHEEGDVR